MEAKTLQAAASAKRAEYQAARSDYRQARERHRTLEARYAALKAGRDSVPADVLRDAQDATRTAAVELDKARGALIRTEQVFNGVLGELMAVPPQQAVTACDDHYPFLLFPVRLECRFVTRGAGRVLHLRIYPDRISVDNLDELLTNDEINSARRFWTEIWRAGGVEERELGAWRVLALAYGANRAAWIARSHAPVNETGPDGGSNRPTKPLDPAQILDPAPQFPDTTGRLDSWSRAPRAMGMPDRFVAIGYVGGQRVFEESGTAIPETLLTGPNPLPEDGEVDDGSDIVDAGMKWMVDFDAAVGVGMAMRIPLPPQAAAGLDELIVLGLRCSAGSEEGRQIAETMIRTHLYSSDGLSFVPQGTPTNDIGPAGPAGATQGADEAVYRREFKRALPAASSDWRDKTDGQHFAEALGIDPAVLRPVANSDGRDQADAQAMNRALWPATMGSFLEEMMSPVLTLGTVKATQRFFITQVSGRGPVPAIRTGDQPYGIAVTSVLSRWSPDKVPAFPSGPATAEDTFRKQLHALLMRFDTIWSGLANSVAFLGRGQDTQAVLLDVLGLQPRSAEHYQRFAVSLDQFTNAQNIFGPNDLSQSMLRLLAAKSQQVQNALGITLIHAPGIYRKIFFDTAKKLSGPFVDRAPRSESAILPALSQDGENYLQWLASSDVDTIRRQDFGKADGKDIAAPNALLYLLLRQAILNAYWDAAWNFFDTARMGETTPRIEPPIVNIRTESQTPTKYQLLYQDAAPLTQAHPDTFQAGATIAALISNPAVISTRPESADLHAAREAIAWLSQRPTAALARAFAEHIDLCSYRLDAWQLGLVNERLHGLRSNGKPTARGSYIGAFGYLEKLKPRQPLTPYGGTIPPELQAAATPAPTMLQAGAEYLLAPSLPHAVTGAVLRNAYLTHAGPDQARKMGIDTTSIRVRRALDVIDGVRNGQGIAALLGYRFERGLHDRHNQAEVDKFIYPLRQKFPLASGQQIPAPAGTPIQALEARNVLDGRKLVRRMQTTGNMHYPFGFTDLPAATTAQAAAIDAEAANLIDVLDAVSDLMLAESAHSAALGNFPRAGAALDSLSGVGIIPEPEMVQTRRSGHGVTHRLCLVVPGAPSPDAAGESEAELPPTPRAAMEPMFNAWLSHVFGSLGDVVCQALWTVEGGERSRDVSLAEIGIQPIDLLYIPEPGTAPAAGEYDTRIALAVRRLEGLADDTAIRIAYVVPVPGKITLFQLLPLIRALKGLCLGRRPLGAQDFASPSQPGGGGGPSGTGANPNGWQIDAYRDRVLAAEAALRALQDDLKATDIALGASPTQAELDKARVQLFSAAGYGIPSALPTDINGTAKTAAAALRDQARRAMARLGERLDAFSAVSPGVTADGQIDQWVAAAKAIFGREFVALPPFVFAQPSEIRDCLGERNAILEQARHTDPFPLETWLAGLARVRQPPAHLERVLTLTQAFRRPEPELVALQLPYKPGDHWLGLDLPEGYPFGSDRVLATAIFATTADADAPQAGLLLDEWTEIIPVKEQTVGLAFQYDAPGSEPPQALLLAVTPEITGAWAWNDLVDTVRETFRMAKNRAVEPRLIDRSSFAQLLPAIMVPFTATGASIGVNLTAAVE